MGLHNSAVHNIRLLRNKADLEEGCVYTQTHIKQNLRNPPQTTVYLSQRR